MADMDTAQKRYASFGVGLDFMRVRPEPDNDITSSTDRTHLLPLLVNVLLGLPIGGGGNDRRRMYPHRAKWHQVKLMFRQGA